MTATRTESEVEIGIWDTSIDGSPDRVLEDEPDGTGPIIKADIVSVMERGSVAYEAEILEANHMTNDLDFD